MLHTTNNVISLWFNIDYVDTGYLFSIYIKNEVIEINYAQIRHYDTANGIGIRSSIFFSGCTHNCHNCFNKAYHDFKYGNKFTNKEINIIKEYIKEDQTNGITLLGGEPLQQNPIEMINFLRDIRSIIDEYNKSIWIYSGYTYEEIILDNNRLEVIKLCDVLIDGRYEERLKNLRLKFRGSSNQRIIDIQKSLEKNKVVLYLE